MSATTVTLSTIQQHVDQVILHVRAVHEGEVGAEGCSTGRGGESDHSGSRDPGRPKASILGDCDFTIWEATLSTNIQAGALGEAPPDELPFTDALQRQTAEAEGVHMAGQHTGQSVEGFAHSLISSSLWVREGRVVPELTRYAHVKVGLNPRHAEGDG